MANLSQCQFDALNALNSSQNVFLTGAAGTGKSYLIKRFIANLDRKVWPVLASTGAAAIRVEGRTFHSFFGLGIMEGGYDATLEKALRDKRIPKRMKRAKGIIIDEISMIPSSALKVAEEIARWSRESDLPWGGLKIISVGDFFQLPPVSKFDKREWAFQSSAWSFSDFKPQVLKTVLRTKDDEFLSILNKVRVGTVDDEVSYYLNSKLADFDQERDITRLFARRWDTEKFNLVKVDEIPGSMIELKTEYSGTPSGVEALKKNAPVPPSVFLKVGAYVMIRQNDPKERWVNGSLGHVRRLTNEYISIDLVNGESVEIGKSSFDILDADGKVTASALNFPINLAYASTIHKSQGATFDSALLDLKGLWEPGQAYVALSRLSSGSGLHVAGWDKSSFKIDPQVVRFYESLENRPLSEINLSLS